MLVLACLGGCTSSRAIRMLPASMGEDQNNPHALEPGTVVDIVLTDGSEYSGELVDYARDELRIRFIPSNYNQEVMTRPRSNFPGRVRGWFWPRSISTVTAPSRF